MHSSIAVSTPLPGKSILMISGDLLPWTQTCQPQTILCTFAHFCCPSVYMSAHCDVFSVLLPCDPQLSHGKLLRMDCQPSYSQPPVTRRHSISLPIQAQHMDIALPQSSVLPLIIQVPVPSVLSLPPEERDTVLYMASTRCPQWILATPLPLGDVFSSTVTPLWAMLSFLCRDMSANSQLHLILAGLSWGTGQGEASHLSLDVYNSDISSGMATKVLCLDGEREESSAGAGLTSLKHGLGGNEPTFAPLTTARVLV